MLVDLGLVAHHEGEVVVSRGGPEVDAVAEGVVDVELGLPQLTGGELDSKIDPLKCLLDILLMMSVIPLMLFNQLQPL